MSVVVVAAAVAVALAQLPQYLRSSNLDNNNSCKVVLDTVRFTCIKRKRQTCMLRFSIEAVVSFVAVCVPILVSEKCKLHCLSVSSIIMRVDM